MKERVIKLLKKILKITGISIASLLLLLLVLPYIMPGTIARQIKILVNQSIEGEVNFSKARLSFFNHFPSLTLTLKDFSLLGSAPFPKDTLMLAGEVAFGIDIPSLIRGGINVNKFFITRADIHVQVNEKGEANYNVYKSAPGSDSSSSGGDTTAALRIEKIIIENSDIIYDDKSVGMLMNAYGLNYTGRGDLTKAVFDLSSNIEIDSFDLYYDKEPYILKKKIKANLVTQVNTNSLALVFKQNKLKINQLPLQLTGTFDFLSNGYKMDFRLKSDDAPLYSVFSVLPPSYNGWLQKTKMDGKASLIASLSGRYIAETGSMPDLDFEMKVRNGGIEYEDTPVPVSNLYLNMNTRLASLNVDSIVFNVDTVFFNVGQDHFSSVFKMRGYQSPYIFTRTNAVLDLEKLDKAIGFENMDLKGKLYFALSADGKYTEGQNPNRMRKDTIVTGIPSFDLKSSVQNGYFHYTSLSQPIQQINFNLNAACPDNDYHHTAFSVENIDIKAMNNYIKGFFRLKNAKDFPVDAQLDALVSLTDIQKFYPLDSMYINGNLAVSLNSSGYYLPEKKIFPKTEGTLKVDNASLKTKYYPAPIEKINIDAGVQNKAGTFSDLTVDVKPISFVFEGKPFMIKADLRNFDNIRYDIQSKGEIDLGRIYRVFSQKGWDVKGVIETDLSLKGSQADAEAGRYSRLDNSGKLKLKEITVYSDLYPLPFLIDKGMFRFQQDLLMFEGVRANYGSSSVTLSGEISNVFNYVAGDGPLRGNMQLYSDRIFLDELMAYQSDSTSTQPDSLIAGSSGVIIIPAGLDLKFNADIKNVDYKTLPIKDVKGEVLITGGELKLNQTGFVLADAATVMDATYKSLSAVKALFTYHISIIDFDVKKMYNEVELFRQLVPAAGKAQGIISLDYNLEGKLNSDMYPIMPSLKGGGVISVKQVKFKGLHLFSAMSKQTGKDEINDPDLSKVDFKTTVANNVITLEKTKIRIAGFRLRMQGQTSFDGKIKFKCRLGLPPLGIIGIPMNITGTGQNPKIKTGKSDELPLEEKKEEENTDN